MAQVNANGEVGNPNGRRAAQQPQQQPGLVLNGAPNGAAAVALPAAAQVAVAVVVANPAIANLAGAGVLAPPGPLHPQFDIEAALLRPPATKSNRNFDIHAWIQ